jgi:hypothetical protein
MTTGFEILGHISDAETIATGRSIRVLKRLKRFYGDGRWRKVKGVAKIRLPDGAICRAEIHWYEMARVGRKEYKIKKLLP